MPVHASKKLATSKSWLIISLYFPWVSLLHMQEAVNSVNAKLEEKRNAKEANQNYLDCIPAPLGTWNDSCSYVFHLLKVQGANSTQESCPDIKSIHLICRICIQQSGSIVSSLGQGWWYDLNLYMAYIETSLSHWGSDSFQVLFWHLEISALILLYFMYMGPDLDSTVLTCVLYPGYAKPPSLPFTLAKHHPLLPGSPSCCPRCWAARGRLRWWT